VTQLCLITIQISYWLHNWRIWVWFPVRAVCVLFTAAITLFLAHIQRPVSEHSDVLLFGWSVWPVKPTTDTWQSFTLSSLLSNTSHQLPALFVYREQSLTNTFLLVAVDYFSSVGESPWCRPTVLEYGCFNLKSAISTFKVLSGLWQERYILPSPGPGGYVTHSQGVGFLKRCTNIQLRWRIRKPVPPSARSPNTRDLLGARNDLVSII
jgi:hypothetical protein